MECAHELTEITCVGDSERIFLCVTCGQRVTAPYHTMWIGPRVDDDIQGRRPWGRRHSTDREVPPAIRAFIDSLDAGKEGRR